MSNLVLFKFQLFFNMDLVFCKFHDLWWTSYLHHSGDHSAATAVDCRCKVMVWDQDLSAMFCVHPQYQQPDMGHRRSKIHVSSSLRLTHPWFSSLNTVLCMSTHCLPNSDLQSMILSILWSQWWVLSSATTWYVLKRLTYFPRCCIPIAI